MESTEWNNEFASCTGYIRIKDSPAGSSWIYVHTLRCCSLSLVHFAAIIPFATTIYFKRLSSYLLIPRGPIIGCICAPQTAFLSLLAVCFFYSFNFRLLHFVCKMSQSQIKYSEMCSIFNVPSQHISTWMLWLEVERGEKWDCPKVQTSCEVNGRRSFEIIMILCPSFRPSSSLNLWTFECFFLVLAVHRP